MADADDFNDDESLADEEAPPTPRNNLLTVVLLLLNVVAALAFAYLLVLDYQKRQQWSYGVFLHDLAMQGLPLKADEAGPTAAYETLPRQRLSEKDLKTAFSKRGGAGGGEFAPVDEVLQSPIKPSHLTPDILKDHFGDLAAVTSLEDEISNLQKKLPEEIEAAAKETVAAAKDPSAKRKLLEKILLSLAYDIYQVKQIDTRLKAAKGDELDALLLDAAQRRMYVDLLAPLEVFRSGDSPSHVLQKAADRDLYKLPDGSERKAFDLDQLKKLLDRQLNSLAGKQDPGVHPGTDWDTMERRRAIAFFLTDLAYLKKPDSELLLPRGLERAQLVCGLYDLPVALRSLTQAWLDLEGQVLSAIKADREGLEVKAKQNAGKLLNIPGFVGQHQHEIQRLLDLKRHIQKAEERLAGLQKQHKAAEELYNDRKAHQLEVGKKVVAARKETHRQIEELRNLNKELFEAQRQLSEAAERNFRLEARIRELEGVKGAKSP